MPVVEPPRRRREPAPENLRALMRLSNLLGINTYGVLDTRP